MSDHVSWVISVEIKPGELDAFRALMDEMVESTRGEAGTEIYEWFISDDGGGCHIYERYADSAAVMAHVTTFGETFAARFMGSVAPTGLTVYGTPNDEATAALSGMGAVFMAPFGGFAR